jgi:predicted lipoprotein with Yx(FWY)xxD motif
MKRVLMIVGGLSLALVAACGGSSTSTGGSSSSSSAASGTVATGSTSLGTVLTDSRGFTLYYFTPEKGAKIVCAGNSACNSTWPPLVSSSGAPSAPSGASGTFAVATLPDGTAEVTYQNWPLHTYSGDSAAGQTNGQGIQGMWFAATPALTAAGSGSGAGSGSTPTATPGYGY